MDNIVLNSVAGAIMIIGLFVASAGMMALTVLIVRRLGKEDALEHPVLATVLGAIVMFTFTGMSAAGAFWFLEAVFTSVASQIFMAVWELEMIFAAWIFCLSVRDGRRAASCS